MKSVIKIIVRIILKCLPGITFPKINVFLNNCLGYSIDKSVRLYSSVELLGNISITIGAHTYIGHKSTITGGLANVIIGDNCDISDQVSIICGTHEIDTVGERVAGKGIGKNITIGNGVWIGYRAIILPGIHIGDQCIIGAGCVVSKDVPARSVVVGNPMRIIKTI